LRRSAVPFENAILFARGISGYFVCVAPVQRVSAVLVEDTSILDVQQGIHPYFGHNDLNPYPHWQSIIPMVGETFTFGGVSTAFVDALGMPVRWQTGSVIVTAT
jgi:hypothetical protein